jgi:hypothetical protein
MPIPRTGALLRRGTEGLTPAHLKELLDNSDKVDAIIAEIGERRSVYLEAEAAAQARVDEADKAEAAVLKRQPAVADQVSQAQAAAIDELGVGDDALHASRFFRFRCPDDVRLGRRDKR